MLRPKGFTLIELLIVIVGVAALVGIGFVVFLVVATL
jgi:prepilin-type N-terminal cleavage/methylation domain-containing protein